MAIRLLFPTLFPHLLALRFHSVAATIPAVDGPAVSVIVNELCRILSDFRSTHDDLETALRPFSSSVSPAVSEQVLERCRHLPSSSHRFFIWSSSLPDFLHTATTYNVVLDILASSRLFPLAWSLLADYRSYFANSSSFRLLFRAYARASLPNEAIRAFRRMPDFDVHPGVDDLHNLISALCRYGFTIPADNFFNKCKSQIPVTQRTYTLLMNGWAAIGKPQEARHLFDEMLHKGFPVDVAAYNSLLEAYCKGGELDVAHKLLQEMKTLHGLVPDAASYGAFIRSHCEAKDVESAMRIIHRMKRHGHTPNVFTYNAVIKLLCEKEMAEDAYELLNEMMARGAKPNAWSYNAILAHHCKLREVNRALRLLVRMDRDSCLPDRHTYNMLLETLIGTGRFDRAFEVWEGMEKRGFFPSASSYAVMIHGLCKKHAVINDACQLFEMMVDEGIPPYLSTCQVLRGELCRFGLGNRIEILADKMRRSSSCNIQELSKAMDESGIVHLEPRQIRSPKKKKKKKKELGNS